MNVLIVDNSQAVRTSLRALLRSITDIGTVREAATLGAALERIRSEPPVVLILDLHLSDGLGDTMLQTFKQLAPKMRIAVFSLHADDNRQQQCLARGADMFFDKAIQAGALRDWLQLAALHQASTESDLTNPNPEKTP
jgi:DNA-binding NarL/FixJ family response regulator